MVLVLVAVATAQAVRHVQHLVFDINIRRSILNDFLRSALGLFVLEFWIPCQSVGTGTTQRVTESRPDRLSCKLAVILRGLISTGSNVYYTGFIEAFY